MIRIDGAIGEGGGQILRSALSLSMITRQPFQIDDIRGKRQKPGLLRQHLTAVGAAKTISRAKTDGDTIGSMCLRFDPGPVRGGDFHFSVGTAGSAILVLQTVLPALMLAKETSTLTIEGGTHNPSAPPFDFLAQSFLPLINQMGPHITVSLDRYGFFPAGGGRFSVTINPVRTLEPLSISSRGPALSREAVILTCHLPPEIAKRQKRMLKNKLNWSDDEVCIQSIRRHPNPGNVAWVLLKAASHTEMFTGFGTPHTPSVEVIGALVSQVRAYQSAQAPISEFLADQLMLPCALAMGRSCFHAVKASSHAVTNRTAIKAFLSTDIEISGTDRGDSRFCFKGIGER